MRPAFSPTSDMNSIHHRNQIEVNKVKHSEELDFGHIQNSLFKKMLTTSHLKQSLIKYTNMAKLFMCSPQI